MFRPCLTGFWIFGVLAFWLAGGEMGVAQTKVQPTPRPLAEDYFTKSWGVPTDTDLKAILEKTSPGKDDFEVLEEAVKRSDPRKIRELEGNIHRALAVSPRNRVELLMAGKAQLLEQRKMIFADVLRRIDAGTAEEAHSWVVREFIFGLDREEMRALLQRFNKITKLPGMDWQVTGIFLITASWRKLLTAENLRSEYPEVRAFLLEGAARDDGHCEELLIALDTKEGREILGRLQAEARAATTVTAEHFAAIAEIGTHTRQLGEPKIQKAFFFNLYGLARTLRKEKQKDSYAKLVAYLSGEAGSSDAEWATAANETLGRMGKSIDGRGSGGAEDRLQ